MDHMNTALEPSERARLLLAKMTVRERAQQLTGFMPNAGLRVGAEDEILEYGIGHIAMTDVLAGQPAAVAATNNRLQHLLLERTRLGIPAIIHKEMLNGIVSQGFTSFPTAIGLAATWSPTLVGEMADLMRRQARAIGVTQGLSPVLDVARDARWGRVHETYGEEVELVTAMGVAFISGLQGDDLRTGVIATGKHFLGYALTEAGQNLAATHLGSRELYDVYATPFEAAIHLAGLRSVMNSYSEIDGVPVAASRAILTDLLRGRLGFAGSVVSDYNSLRYLFDRQCVARDAREAGVLALAAGIDVELPSEYGFGSVLAEAVDKGHISEQLLDQAVLRVLTHKFELGLFEQPFVDDDPIVLTQLAGEGRDLSARLAERSITLLKNSDGVLPLARGQVRRIAVLGPHADTPASGFAWYTYPTSMEMIRGMMTGQSHVQVGMEHMVAELPPAAREAAAQQMQALAAIDIQQIARDDYNSVGLADAIRETAPDTLVTAVSAGTVLASEPNGIEAALAAAADADVVILALGGRAGAFATNMTEGEGVDSADIALPAHQVELARRVAELGKSTVTVLFTGRPYAITEVNEASHAVVAAYYPGPEGPRAVARILFGDVVPSGKLPYTLPRATGQVPIYQAIKRGSGYRREPKDQFQRYVDLPATPLYPFGHGLSYTTFAYGPLQVDQSEVSTDGTIRTTIDIRNTGTLPGADVVQLYAATHATGITRPYQQLVGFARVELLSDHTATVSFDIDVSQLGFTDPDGRFVVEPGAVTLRAGASSDDIRAEATVTIIGDTTDVSGRRSFLPTVRVTQQ